MQTPPQSLDVNPIENLWPFFKKKKKKKRKKEKENL